MAVTTYAKSYTVEAGNVLQIGTSPNIVNSTAGFGQVAFTGYTPTFTNSTPSVGNQVGEGVNLGGFTLESHE